MDSHKYCSISFHSSSLLDDNSNITLPTELQNPGNQTSLTLFNNFQNMDDTIIRTQDIKEDQAQNQVQQPGLENAIRQRTQWSLSEQRFFFKILANHVINNPKAYQNWKTPNKKNVFKKMAEQIGSKNGTQCKSKYNSLKRRHSNKKQNPKCYIKCMRDLIIQELKHFSESDMQCQQLLEQITLNIQFEQYFQRDRESQQQIRRQTRMFQSINSPKNKSIGQTRKQSRKSRIKKCQQSQVQELQMNLL